MDLKQYVSEVKDWPSAGVSFKDITTIMDMLRIKLLNTQRKKI